MTSVLSKFKDIRNENILSYKKSVSKLYKEGYSLGEICRIFKLDISSVLIILKKCKFKKKKLYQIFEYQSDRLETKNVGLILKRDEHYLEKYFPSTSSSFFSNSYYLFWKDRYKRTKEKQRKCRHNIRHIRCGICNKILGDASNVPIKNNVFIENDKTNYNEEEKN